MIVNATVPEPQSVQSLTAVPPSVSWHDYDHPSARQQLAGTVGVDFAGGYSGHERRSQPRWQGAIHPLVRMGENSDCSYKLSLRFSANCKFYYLHYCPWETTKNVSF